jgi:hypothetical protein
MKYLSRYHTHVGEQARAAPSKRAASSGSTLLPCPAPPAMVSRGKGRRVRLCVTWHVHLTVHRPSIPSSDGWKQHQQARRARRARSGSASRSGSGSGCCWAWRRGTHPRDPNPHAPTLTLRGWCRMVVPKNLPVDRYCTTGRSADWGAGRLPSPPPRRLPLSLAATGAISTGRGCSRRRLPRHSRWTDWSRHR